MSLIFVLLFPVLLFVVVVFLRWICQSNKCNSSSGVLTDSHFECDNAEISPPEATQNVISLADAFAHDSGMLWDCINPLLESIGTAGTDGRTEVSLLPLYGTLAHFYPELFEGVSLTDVLSFLAHEGLIARNHGNTSITALGLELLTMRENDRRVEELHA